MPQYGEVRVDFITYTTGVAPNEGNVTVPISGLINAPTFSGDVVIEGDLTVSGLSTFSGITVTGDATIGGDLTVSGDIIASGVTISGITGLFASGTEAAPSISFVDDTDTGFYNAAANEVRITTSGNDRLTVDSAGNVGIGTTDPQSNLHISDTSTNNSTIRLEGGEISSTPSQLIGTLAYYSRDSSGDGPQVVSEVTCLTGQGTSAAGGQLRFRTCDSPSGSVVADRVTIDRGGKVGIGTTDPDELLHIEGADAEFKCTNSAGIDTTGGTEQVFKFDIEGQRNNLYASVGSIIFRQDGNSWSTANQFTKPTRIEFCTQDLSTSDTSETPRLVVDQDGNVGIRTTSPNERFSVDVNGTTNRAIEIYNSDTVLSDGEVVHAIRFTQNDVSFPNTTHASIETVTTGSTGLLNMVFKARDNTEYMRINTNGNVGIGTTDPLALLHVSNGASVTTLDADADDVYISNSGNVGITLGAGSNDKCSIYFAEQGISNSRGRIVYDTNDESLQLWTVANERVRIDSVGRLLVGGTTAVQTVDHLNASFTPQLQSLNQGGTPAALLLAHFRSNNGVLPQLVLQKARGTFSAPLTVINNDTLGAIDFNAYDGTSYLGGAIIKGEVDGTPGTNDMPGRLVFSTTADNASTPTPRMTIKSTGNVGIGTTDPSEPLDIMAIPGNSRIQLGDSGYSNVPAIIARTNTDSGYRNLGYDAASHRFYASNVEKMRLDGNGKLLVGTTSARTNFFNSGISPGLQLEGAGSLGAFQRFASITNNFATDGDGGGFLVLARSKSNTLSSNVLVAQNDQLGAIGFQGNDGTQFVLGARIEGLVDGTPGADDMPGRLVFSTTADGASSPTPRMTIKSNGNVGIGITSPGATLDVNGDIRARTITADTVSSTANMYALQNVGGTLSSILWRFVTGANDVNVGTERMRIDSTGNLYSFSGQDSIVIRNSNGAGTTRQFISGRHSGTSVTGGGTLSFQVFTNGNVENTNNSYTAISDIKLKENIVDANSQWDDLKALQIRNYNFKEGQTHTQIGLIAQEVELVSPGLVNESPDRDEDGNDLGTVTKSVNYSVLYMKAVKALQEAMERIEQLESRLAALENN